jgi:nitroreductase
VVVLAALADAETREVTDPAYVAELRDWTGRPGGVDGLAASQPGWPAERVSDVPLRDFTGQGDHPHPGAGEPPLVERDALVLLGTDGDDAAAFLATGRALAWLWLRVSAAGLSAQPLGQALDAVDSRLRLGHDLRVVGHPQYLLRLGYGSAATTVGRRPTADLLSFEE